MLILFSLITLIYEQRVQVNEDISFSIVSSSFNSLSIPLVIVDKNGRKKEEIFMQINLEPDSTIGPDNRRVSDKLMRTIFTHN